MLSDIVRDEQVKWISEHWSDYNEYNESDDKLHFTIINIPFDYAINFRPGARFAPEAILTQLDNCTLYNADKRVDFSGVKLSKFGTLPANHSLKKSYADIIEVASNIKPSIKPIFLGGDHSIVDPIYRGIASVYSNRKIGLLSFDAHFDYRVPVPGYESSGSWLKTLEDILPFEALGVVGISAPVYSAYYEQSFKSKGALVITPYELRNNRLEIREKLIHFFNSNCDAIYITVDIDCIDQGFVTGTSAPNPNGLLPYELKDLIFEICSEIETVGMDICEVSPYLDSYQNLSSNLASQILIDFISGNVIANS